MGIYSVSDQVACCASALDYFDCDYDAHVNYKKHMVCETLTPTFMHTGLLLPFFLSKLALTSETHFLYLVTILAFSNHGTHQLYYTLISNSALQL